MKLWVTLEGRDTEVEVRAEGGRVILVLEGRTLEADFMRLPDGEVYSLLVGGRSHEVRVQGGQHAIEVGLHGNTIPVEVRHPLEKALQAVQHAGRARGGEVIVAPMPGLVVALKVQAGDRVAPGQAVAVVEAMKMQNELAARIGGIVSEVDVTERSTVSAGQVLLRLRAEAGA